MAQLVEKKVKNSTVSWLPVNEEHYSVETIHSSWCSHPFLFKEEDKTQTGLRPPQIGGIFSALGYERSDGKFAATLVMPTGTGKTETILSMVVAGRFKKTLVIVPSDALREQMKEKFIKLGLLRELGLISDLIPNPIVATIKHGVDEEADLKELLNSNVIIASVSALNNFKKELLINLTNECSHLIVDEAHHVTASTWAKVKSQFSEKSVFQFTATPFRSDGSRVEGKIIFNYPLRKAQDDGYFKPIEFHSVKEFVEEKSDQAIATKAIKLLREDIELGYDHILMARANTIARAQEIFAIYEKEQDLNPVLVNSRVKKKADVLKAIKNREHKIIVCVDMLGEGFDLPQLKISAIHDPHKSINIMLQFTGRFTRTATNVGDAKFVANIANANVNESLDELYKEDSDWNNIVSDISHTKITDEKEYQDFRAAFSDDSKLLDLGLTPNISTTVFRMQNATWLPEHFSAFENKNFQIADSILNDDKSLLVFSVKALLPVGWTRSKELFDESWDLYIAYFNRESGLLFVHSSAKDGLVKRLVNLIARNATQIKGDYVFRTLAGLKRLKLQNVGLNKNKKGLRYSMHTGTEINDQIPDIEANRARKSNIFGKGYEQGKLVSIGCSHKGKVWAMDSNSLDKWVEWCKSVASKILDDTIDTNEVMKTAMQMEELHIYPDIAPLAAEWPLDILRKTESKISLKSESWSENLINCELNISKTQNKDVKSLIIELENSFGIFPLNLQLIGDGEIKVTSTSDYLAIKIGEQEIPLTEYFAEHPPTIFLRDTSIIDGGFRYFSNDSYSYLYPIEKVEAWNWEGVDISIESQKTEKISNSIQFHTIQKVKAHYDLVFDDDGSGEIADIVAIKNIDDKELIIDLFHCKYCSKKNAPGARVDDIYQVAGQAEKSLKWLENIEKLLNRLMDRERLRLSKNKPSRIDKGHFEDLVQLIRVAKFSKCRFGVAIVQPAVSKARVSDDQLNVLGATAAYIDEVSGVKLRVIVNE